MLRTAKLGNLLSATVDPGWLWIILQAEKLFSHVALVTDNITTILYNLNCSKKQPLKKDSQK